jgi:hypothetical protein
MFIGTVVAGAVAWTSGGAKMRGALIRDVLAYAISVAVVLAILASGKVAGCPETPSESRLISCVRVSTLACALLRFCERFAQSS